MLLNEILENLRHRNLEPALLWAEMHREALLEQCSSLEFKLHRLHFLNLVSQGAEKQSEALAYVRKQFPPFVRHHETGNRSFRENKIILTKHHHQTNVFRCRYPTFDGRLGLPALWSAQFSLQEALRPSLVD